MFRLQLILPPRARRGLLLGDMIILLLSLRFRRQPCRVICRGVSPPHRLRFHCRLNRRCFNRRFSFDRRRRCRLCLRRVSFDECSVILRHRLCRCDAALALLLHRELERFERLLRLVRRRDGEEIGDLKLRDVVVDVATALVAAVGEEGVGGEVPYGALHKHIYNYVIIIIPLNY
jgi:hypothetical protein